MIINHSRGFFGVVRFARNASSRNTTLTRVSTGKEKRQWVKNKVDYANDDGETSSENTFKRHLALTRKRKWCSCLLTNERRNKRNDILPVLWIKINEHRSLCAHQSPGNSEIARKKRRCFFVWALRDAVCWFGQRLKERPSSSIKFVASRKKRFVRTRKKTRGCKTLRKLPSRTRRVVA